MADAPNCGLGQAAPNPIRSATEFIIEDLGSSLSPVALGTKPEEIECVMQATVGMYGDLQGIADKTLQQIEGLNSARSASPRWSISVSGSGRRR